MSGFTLADLVTYEQSAAKPVITPPASDPKPETPAPQTESSPVAAEVATDAQVEPSVDPTPTPKAEEQPPAEEEPASEPEPKGSRARERIEDLVAERNALKKYAEYLQTQMVAPKPQAETPAADVKPVATDDAPTLESVGFDTDKWTKAMHAWTAKQIEQGVSKAVTNVQAKQQEAAASQTFVKRMEEYASQNADFKLVIGNPNLPQLADDAAKIVTAHEMGPAILHHLGKNPDKAARIARQSSAAQEAAIDRLIDELSATKPQSQQKKPTPSITKAPAPPTPTPAGGAAQVNPMKMSMGDFVKHERAQAAEKRQARNRR